MPAAWAQASEQETDTRSADSTEIKDETIVTGIRRNLKDSVDLRCEALGVVDAISAADIGKFLDQNLAEALQRVPGVSISRSNNESSQIIVRGFGPEFNLVTLNGRSMPTAGGRAFDFNDLATEGIREVRSSSARASRRPGAWAARPF